MPAFNSSASQSRKPLIDISSLENNEMLKKFLRYCSSCVDAIHIEDIAKYPKVSVKITPETKLMKQCTGMDINKVPLDNTDLASLNLESHIDQLGFLLRDIKPTSLFTLLSIDNTIDIIREFSENKKWLGNISEKFFTITGLNDCAHWRELRIDRVYRLINGFLKSTRSISDLSIEENVIKIATEKKNLSNWTSFYFDVEKTITKARLNKILALATCISGVRVNLEIPLPWLDYIVASQCLDSLGAKYKLNPAYLPPRYAYFSYLSLGPIGILLEY